MDQRNDAMFMQIASQHRDIKTLLHSFFGFLKRKTDFYLIQPPEGSNMGFGPGVAEHEVLHAFRSFPQQKIPSKVSAHAVTSNAKTSSDSVTAPTSAAPKRAERSKSGLKATIGVSTDFDLPSTVLKKTKNASCASDSSGSTAASSVPMPKLSKDGKQEPCGNGGVTANYWWTQTLEDLTAHVEVPANTRSKDIVCNVRTQHIKVGVKGSPPLVEGEMVASVRASDALWSIADNARGTRTVSVTLDKVVHTWWPTVVKGDTEIDTTKVDSTRHVEDYDEATQAEIRKIMFDQRQKAAGLPTSDEIARDAILEKARHLPGSPYLLSSQTLPTDKT